MGRVIHVAGTNGKGSTCAYLRAIGEAAGLKVHVLASPHLVRFAERIRIAGRLIEEDELDRRIEHVGGVEAAAQSHLDHAKVGRILREGVECEAGGDLEEADRLAGVGGLDLVDAPVELRLADDPAGDADALGEAH